MPLLGRHKSSGQSQSSSSAPRADKTALAKTTASTVASKTGARQDVCESPLFGIRRQLPLDYSCTSQQPQTGSGSGKQQLQSVNNSNDSGLSSIPQQITRQQIHYAFSIMDSNQDGQVDVRELSQMLSNLGIPIDEAILSHIMTNTVSKRGDHRISEAEFLDWISHLIQIRGDSPSERQQQQPQQKRSTAPTKSSAVRATRSSAAGYSLIAQPSEPPPRNRRGSGSGLALMRSLSSSSASSASAAHHHSDQASPLDEHSQSCDRLSGGGGSSSSRGSRTQGSASRQQPKLQHQSSTDSVEARNDLRAAFCVFDLDGDGFITLDEVRAGLKLLGEAWSPTELRRLFNKCSANDSTSDLSKQRISIDDFVQLLL